MDYRSLLASDVIKDFCRTNHIRKMSLFGSVLRADFGPESDVDILIEFDPGHIPGLDFFRMETELSQMIGRKVDLQTPGFLGKEIYSSVIKEAVPAYE